MTAVEVSRQTICFVYSRAAVPASLAAWASGSASAGPLSKLTEDGCGQSRARAASSTLVFRSLLPRPMSSLIHHQTVFIVDDDAAVRDALSLLLSLRGYATAMFAC